LPYDYSCVLVRLCARVAIAASTVAARTSGLPPPPPSAQLPPERWVGGGGGGGDDDGEGDPVRQSLSMALVTWGQTLITNDSKAAIKPNLHHQQHQQHQQRSIQRRP
jgi:hypothetical protein